MKPLFVTVTLLVLLTLTSSAQQAFTSAGEVQVSGQRASSPPAVALQTDGSALIIWPDAAQWYDSNLNTVGGNNSAYTNGIAAVALSNNRWGIVKDNPTDVFWGRRCQYRLWMFDGTNYTNRSEVLFSMYWHYPPEGTEIWPELCNTVIDAKNDTLLWNVISDVHSEDGMIPEAFVYGNLYRGAMRVNGQADPSPCLWTDSTLLWNKCCVWPGGYFGEGINIDGLPWETSSQLRDGNFLTFGRYRCTSPSWDSLVQTIRVRSVQNDSVIREFTMDPILSRETDVSPRLLYGPNGKGFWFIAHGMSDSIGIRTIDLSSGSATDWRCLFNSVKRNKINLYLQAYPDSMKWRLNIMPDYAVRLLDDGSAVVVWTGLLQDSSTDVFVAILDTTMTMIGVPKRISSDGSGNQYAPSLAVNGKNIAVAWMDERSGEPFVYTRRFTADQLVAAESPPMADVYAIAVIAPNPAHGRATIRYTLDAAAAQDVHGATLVVYDVLGRIVLLTRPGASHAGSNTANLDLTGLSAGTYRVVLQSSTKTVSKSILVY